MLDEFVDEEDNFNLSSLPPSYANKLNGFLREACKQGHLTCVNVLVDKGADVNYIDRQEKTTVLQVAIMNGRRNIIEYLLGKASEKTVKAAYSYTREKRDKLDEALRILDKKSNNNTAINDISKQVSDLKVDDLTKEVISNNKEVALSAKDSPLFTLDLTTQTEYQKSNDDLQKRFDLFKKESEEIVKELNSQIEKLGADLNAEREANSETRDLLNSLGKELTSKDEEISSVKVERDSERRAKEIAKRILSVDNMNIPVVKRNPLLDFADKPAHKSRSTMDFSNFDIQGKGNKPPVPTTSALLVPNRKKQEGSKDDLEIHIDDNGVKYRVRRLVKRWEQITNV